MPRYTAGSAEDRWSWGPLDEAGVLKLPAAVEIVDCSRALNLGRSVTYELLRRDEYPVPVMRLGRRWLVRKTVLLEFLGIQAQRHGAPQEVA